MPLEIEYINTSYPIPNEGNGYLYINLNNPIVAWETARGIFYSSEIDNELNKVNRPSLWMANIIQSNNNKMLLNEIIIDNIRRKHFPGKISRIEGMYFLKDLDSAKDCLNWGGHFIIANLSEIFYSTKKPITRCDSNWITNLKVDSEGIIDFNYYDSILRYWNGEKYPYCDFPAWEYIIDGILNIMSPRIKYQAYKNVIEKFPASKDLLLYSMVAVHLEMNTGHSIPYIQYIKENEYKLSYLMKYQQGDKNKILSADSKICTIANISLNPNAQLVIPDLTIFFKNFKISINKNSKWDIEYIKIHI